VIEVSADAFEAVPETLPANLRGVLRGVFKLEERLLLEIDADTVIYGHNPPPSAREDERKDRS
jgi:chemotaxis signal transduction protein